MGYKYEVHAWMRQEDGKDAHEQWYGYEQVYAGKSLIGAIRAMRRAKLVSGCVRLEWR